nr:hypothetical protein [Tanacetum cinerariifolium]
MFMEEKINLNQKPQELKSRSLQPESSKSVNSSKQSQSSKPNGKNPDSSKLVRPKPLQKPKLKSRLVLPHRTENGFGLSKPFLSQASSEETQSLYDGKVLLEKHDPPVVYDSEETLQLAQESRDKMKQMNKEIKPANYTKINHLSGVFVPQKASSREELYFLNNSKTANISKLFLIPNKDLSDDTTPSVPRKFLNEVKSTIVTLQRVVKQRMTIETHNSKFVEDFKSLANEADASLAKHKALELEIERLLKAVVSQDIMIMVQNESVVDTSDLQIELERTKERFETVSLKRRLNMLNFGMIDTKSDTSANTKFAKQPTVENLPKVGKTNALSNPVTSNSVSTPRESKGVNNDKVIAPEMFRINPSKTSREEKYVPNTVRASARTKPITVSQPHVITKKDVIQFLKEAAKFVGDFKSLAKEVDSSLAKHKILELDNERLLKAVVSQDIISVGKMLLLLFHQTSKLSLNVRKNTLKT